MADLMKPSEAAQLAGGLVSDDGAINVRATARTLGRLVHEVLTGETHATRAREAIRGIREIIHLADAVRRSSDSAQPLLRVEDEAVEDGGSVGPVINTTATVVKS